MQSISALTLRKQFGKYLDLVAEKKETVMVSRANRPMVALIPAEQAEDYERFATRRGEREEAARRMDVLRSQLKPVNIVDLVRRSRDSR